LLFSFRLRSFVVATVVATACLLALIPGSPAFADRLYPPGCNDTVRYWWQDSCWAGQYYVDDGTMVLGIQYVLLGTGHNPGLPDCDFGPKTDAATVLYQQRRQLVADGIVGPQTWWSMQLELTFSGVSDVYGNYYNVGPDGLRFYLQYLVNPTWFVLDPWYPPGAAYVAMSVNETGFCP